MFSIIPVIFKLTTSLDLDLDLGGTKTKTKTYSSPATASPSRPGSRTCRVTL